MNKNFARNPLRFLLLIIIAFSSGCEQSSITDSTQSIITNSVEPSLTPTLMPCILPPQATPSEFVKTADEWFQSPQPSIVERSNYNPRPNEWIWNRFCEKFQKAVLSQEYWINYPTEIALRLAGFPNDDFWYPDTVTAYYRRHSPFIVTVVIFTTGLLNDSVNTEEVRVDLIYDDDTWKVQWFGFRWLCIRDQTDEWVTSLCP